MPMVADIHRHFPAAQIDWVVDAYTRGEVADEQMSALAMAILLNGMGREEISRWTAAYPSSSCLGRTMRLAATTSPVALSLALYTEP